jgi:hypothetical protein
MTSQLRVLDIRRKLGRDRWSAASQLGPDSWAFISKNEPGSIIVSVAPHADGVEWVHASIAWQTYMPTYADLSRMHAAVYGAGWAYQVFAPRSSHVNLHEFALHLWGRLDGAAALPDFTEGLPDGARTI